jgi:hypothetical protein
MVQVLFRGWDLGNQQQGINQTPANLTIQYLDQIRDEAITFSELKLVREGVPPINGNPALEWVYEARSDIAIKDPLNGEDYRHFLILSQLNPDETFRKYAKMIVSYRGSVFDGQAAKMVLTWLKDFSTIGDYLDEEPLVPYRVFKLQWTPEIGLRELQGLGLSPKQITKQSVQDALEGLDSRKAVVISMAYRDSQSMVKELSENNVSAGEMMAEGLHGVVVRDGIIMKPPSFSWKALNWKMVLAIALGAIGIYWLYLNGGGGIKP